MAASPARHQCPWPDWADVWIETPAVWLGRHGQRYAEAAAKAREAGLRGAPAEFSAYLALLDNWQLPGLNGPPERWDVLELPLAVLAWVNSVVGPLFLANFAVPKGFSPLLSRREGQEADTELMETAER